jgi:hypothetical protein
MAHALLLMRCSLEQIPPVKKTIPTNSTAYHWMELEREVLVNAEAYAGGSGWHQSLWAKKKAKSAFERNDMKTNKERAHWHRQHVLGRLMGRIPHFDGGR